MPTGGHGHVVCMGNLGGIFSQENTPEARTGTHKGSFFPYKQVSRRNGEHEWLRITTAFILCDLVWKVQKNHAVNREGSFNMYGRVVCHYSCWQVPFMYQCVGEYKMRPPYFAWSHQQPYLPPMWCMKIGLSPDSYAYIILTRVSLTNIALCTWHLQ